MSQLTIPFAEVFKFGAIHDALIDSDGVLYVFYEKDALSNYGQDIIPALYNGAKDYVFIEAMSDDVWLNTKGVYKLYLNVDWKTTDSEEVALRNKLIRTHIEKASLFSDIKNSNLAETKHMLDQLFNVWINYNVCGVNCVRSGPHSVFEVVMDVDSGEGNMYDYFKDRYNNFITRYRASWFTWLTTATTNTVDNEVWFEFSNGLRAVFPTKYSEQYLNAGSYCKVTEPDGSFRLINSELDLLILLEKYF